MIRDERARARVEQAARPVSHGEAYYGRRLARLVDSGRRRVVEKARPFVALAAIVLFIALAWCVFIELIR